VVRRGCVHLRAVRVFTTVAYGWGSKKDFTTTSGTLFASHKLPLRGYLAIAVFCNEVKGKCALALSRDLGLSYKSTFVLLHELREVMAEEEEMKGRVVGGEGKTAEIDGGYFGGYIKPTNLQEDAWTAALLAIRTASARSLLSSVSVAAIRSPPCSAPRAKPLQSSAPVLPRAPKSMRTKAAHRMACVIATK
jgi:hypothetical protein